MGTETSAAVRSRGIYHTPAGTITKATSQSSADRQCSSYDNETAGFGDTAQDSYSYDNSRAFVVGSFIWAGFDYIGEPTPYSSYPSKSSYYGAIDTAGFPKDVYYFYKSRWTTSPVVHILPHWNWSAGTTVTVYVYNNCDSVELFLNNASQGAKTMSGGALRLEWSVPWASGTLRADCTRGGSVVATDQVKTADVAARVVLSADRSTITANGRDLAFITGDIQDANGLFVPNGSSSVSFSRLGAGPARRRRQRQSDRHRLVQGDEPQGVQRQGAGHREVDRGRRIDRRQRDLVRPHRWFSDRHGPVNAPHPRPLGGLFQ